MAVVAGSVPNVAGGVRVVAGGHGLGFVLVVVGGVIQVVPSLSLRILPPSINAASRHGKRGLGPGVDPRFGTERRDRGPHTGPMRFRTTLQLAGRTATGFRVPEEVVQALGKGKRPPGAR